MARSTTARAVGAPSRQAVISSTVLACLDQATRHHAATGQIREDGTPYSSLIIGAPVPGLKSTVAQLVSAALAEVGMPPLPDGAKESETAMLDATPEAGASWNRTGNGRFFRSLWLKRGPNGTGPATRTPVDPLAELRSIRR